MVELTCLLEDCEGSVLIERALTAFFVSPCQRLEPGISPEFAFLGVHVFDTQIESCWTRGTGATKPPIHIARTLSVCFRSLSGKKLSAPKPLEGTPSNPHDPRRFRSATLLSWKWTGGLQR